MKFNKTNTIKNPLRSLLAAVCAWAILVSLVSPVIATEVPETTPETTAEPTAETTAITEESTEATIPETTVETEGSSGLEEILRAEIAAYNERNGISPEMPDNALANAYFALDSDGARAAWEDAQAIIDRGADLTAAEADTLYGEKSSKLFLRFYSVMNQINNPVMLAVTNSTAIEGLTVSDNGYGSTTVASSGSITSKHTAGDNGCGTDYTHEVKITIQNTSGSPGTLKFKSWSITGNNGGTFTITKSDNSTTTTTSGEDFSDDLAVDASITISYFSQGSTEAFLELEDVQLLGEESASNIKFLYDDAYGSVSYGSTAVANEETVSIEAHTVFTAAPSNGAKFAAWLDADNKVLGKNTTLTVEASGDQTIRALFVHPTKSNAWFDPGDGCLYSDWTTAFSKGSVVAIACDGLLPKGNYTVEAGKTFLIPCDAAHTVYTTQPGVVESVYTKPVTSYHYRTLTMSEGANIVVNGAMSLAGSHTAKMGYNGHPTGYISVVQMSSGSSITINQDANLYAWGYIAGSGTVTVKSGGTVYENFQVTDWRGGTASLGMLDNSQKVFPMTQYYVQNVEVPMTLESGATEYGCMSVDLTGYGLKTLSVPFIGSSAMFRMSSGSMTKDYDEGSDRLIVDIDGNITMSSMYIYITSFLGKDIAIDSTKYVLPINNNITVNINSGTTTVDQEIAILPGTEIIVAENASFKLDSGTNLFIYDSNEWVGNGYVYSNRDYRPINYVYGGKIATRAALTDAKIEVKGTVDTSSGYVYTSSGGAAIIGVDGAQAIVSPGSTTQKNYQATQSGTDITYVEVPITSAKLQNADGTYVETAGASASSTYNYKHGKWFLGDHTITSVPTSPTCTETGYTTHTCACGHSYTADEVDATGHSYNNWTITTAAKLDAMPIETGTCTNTNAGTPCTATTTRQVIQSAQIGETKYDTLQEALAAVESPTNLQTVTLLTNFTTDEIPVSQLVTIDKGSYTATITAGAGYRIADTTDTSVTIRKNPEVVATNIAVNEGLDLYFYVPAADIGNDKSDYVAVVTKSFADDREENPVEKSYASGSWEPYPSTDNLKYYRFGFDDISAKEMTDNVTVVIKHTDNTYTSNTYEQTIQNYVIQTLENYEKQGDNTQKTEYLRNALVDMLVYGTAAQEMFEYNESVPAWNPDGFETLKSYEGYITNYQLLESENQKIWDRVAGVTISARNKLLYTFYFSVADPTGMYAQVVYTHHNDPTPTTYTVYAEDFYKRNEGLYGVDVPKLSIVDGFQLLKCTLYDENGTVIGSGQDSIAGYAYRNQGSADIYLSMMRFVKSAQNYFYYEESAT